MMSKKPWGGRFKGNTDKLVESFTASIGFDKRLYRYDIMGSIAHCKMLGKSKIITQTESKKIIKGLKSIERSIDNGSFQFEEGLEDIHMNIEKKLIDKIGAVGGKLHTARSRNDQVALDIRLYLRHEIQMIINLTSDFCRALIKLAANNLDVIMPGYTHLQRAQPVLFSHHLLAYVEMLKRDQERLLETLKRVNVLPLGSSALAGTSFPIDRRYIARLLNFPEISQNSLDAVSDRDFSVEFCSASCLLMMHLSRMSEELILWSSSEFSFIELDDSFCTGSSIMPQKKN
ncbi:MAG: argininosuccinate lyase, partial [Nitrospinota bacterium]|nr:argininosuccinate lyase [Nitrospinota bacterium]